MAMMKLTVIGNIGADAVQRETNGRKYTTFNVAVSSKFKNQDGTETENTTWISCYRDGHTTVDQWLKKGRQVYIEGTPRISIYTDSQGHPQCNMRMNVGRIELLGGKDDDQKQPQKPQPQEGDNDDMPF